MASALRRTYSLKIVASGNWSSGNSGVVSTSLFSSERSEVLPDSLARDPDRLARFKREAQVLASLNHPNIAAIYGLEEADSSKSSGQAVLAIVMEFVEGPTLAEQIASTGAPGPKGPGLLLQDVLPIARQMADAIEAAHEQGVMHRDLKPANVKLRPDGVVKVLDFGLANHAHA